MTYDTVQMYTAPGVAGDRDRFANFFSSEIMSVKAGVWGHSLASTIIKKNLGKKRNKVGMVGVEKVIDIYELFIVLFFFKSDIKLILPNFI